ncbi:trigger factor [Peptoniphilus indolicus]|uniref:Trigger factor n=3 Tax=Peptoniphilus TaxID=162289 RepID=G4D4M2_9FIRM|nr:trigger factor [Peptoniphilus indolicus]EGY79569.1 trigger factor [Peptoniphilus indolicus ATCC 29427]SUB74691.1 Trigger factor [Peptoniphilus indolicus]
MTDIKRENNTVKFEMVLKAEEVKIAEDTVFKKNRKYFQVPGFRKGKVPRKIIENVYGKEVFLEDAINEILPKKYEETIEELKLEVVDQPHVNIEEAHSGEDIKVEISVDVKPEVKIEGYKGIEVEDVKYEVTEELLNAEIDQQRSLNARVLNIDDRAAEEGDKVNIDFVGKVDGEEFEGGAGENQDLVLGSNTFIPGFEKQIEGHNIDDEFDVNVTFPEDYFSEDLKGKEAVFSVRLNSISKEELPELDDEFIKDISEFDTVEEYKNDLREKKVKQFEERSIAEKKEAISKKLVEIVEVDVPKGMVDAQINTQMQNFDQNLRSQGMNLEDYLGMIGVEVKDFAENLREDALKQVKSALALEKVAELEGIVPTDEDVDAEIENIVNLYFKDNEEQKTKMREYMNGSNRESIKEDLMNKKTLDYLYENAKFIEPAEETDSEEDK